MARRVWRHGTRRDGSRGIWRHVWHNTRGADTRVQAALLVAVAMLVAATPARLQGESLVVEAELPSPQVITFDGFSNWAGDGAVVSSMGIEVGWEVGESVQLEYTRQRESGSVRVGPMDHSLGANGEWTGLRGVQTDSGVEITFTFRAGPVAGVGAFMNYAPHESEYAGVVRIEALAADGSVLEGYDLEDVAPIDTSDCAPAPRCVDQGAFRGILRQTDDIHAFRVTGGFHALDDLRFTRISELPSPGS